MKANNTDSNKNGNNSEIEIPVGPNNGTNSTNSTDSNNTNSDTNQTSNDTSSDNGGYVPTYLFVMQKQNA